MNSYKVIFSIWHKISKDKVSANRAHFRESYLQSTAETGLVTLLIPDKPTNIF